MPSIEELYKSKMTWPRLVIKFLVEALLAYNCYHYNTAHLKGYDCWANEMKQPRADQSMFGEDEGSPVNMTAKFTQVIFFGMILALIGLINCIVEMANKFVDNSGLRVLNGVIDTTVGFAAIAWVTWASIVRLSHNGKICAGATMNVTEATEPYAYEQGVFLQVVLMLSYTVPPVLLVATNCGCL
uniref:MARVEL domain-containing protein n=1 Tax=Favella ehrenbergii TaxID=182087 RepID=A0A7S3I616_9SPIT|mmetsp:Transcript_543/g.713  ORF Transcript_543/g.713 Transcript_543/m.713 type:complete len:185 (+) Transcript_543:13-567(+)|eukprot:CAMPEP_0170469724 /NCGR_PEP_ID=MMETSP0123-20130129/12459_1 /TAXON_ID=182087 /ORGANISM="Favella ehrenbergii, Strain Fehren 1" /LENGTH=184 /DNA_ID=CAMNT_0010736689 /DNA_START=18 /DNA_END=572 /DNA_ORIENTATION=-